MLKNRIIGSVGHTLAHAQWVKLSVPHWSRMGFERKTRTGELRWKWQKENWEENDKRGIEREMTKGKLRGKWRKGNWGGNDEREIKRKVTKGELRGKWQKGEIEREMAKGKLRNNKRRIESLLAVGEADKGKWRGQLVKESWDENCSTGTWVWSLKCNKWWWWCLCYRTTCLTAASCTKWSPIYQRWVYTIQPWCSLQCHFIQSHIEYMPVQHLQELAQKVDPGE